MIYSSRINLGVCNSVLAIISNSAVLYNSVHKVVPSGKDLRFATSYSDSVCCLQSSTPTRALTEGAMCR